MQGSALLKTIINDTPNRKAVLFGVHGVHINITDGKYVYMRAPTSEENFRLFEYTLMPTHMRGPFSPSELQNIELEEPFSFTKGCKTMKIPAKPWTSGCEHGTQLFDLVSDPKQENPIKNADIEDYMIREMIDLMLWNDAPSEQFIRMGLKDPKNKE